VQEMHILNDLNLLITYENNMFYEIVIRDQVHDDIIELTDYIYRFSFNKNISKKVYDNLYKSIFSLDFMPNRFEKYL